MIAVGSLGLQGKSGVPRSQRDLRDRYLRSNHGGILTQGQAGSEFNPQQSQNNADLSVNPREKSAIRGDQMGAHYLSVTFAYSMWTIPKPACCDF
jgi:hypothetical protein